MRLQAFLSPSLLSPLWKAKSRAEAMMKTTAAFMFVVNAEMFEKAGLSHDKLQSFKESVR
jgi:hypothetical protein